MRCASPVKSAFWNDRAGRFAGRPPPGFPGARETRPRALPAMRPQAEPTARAANCRGRAQTVSELTALTLAAGARRAEEEKLLRRSSWPTRILPPWKRRARSTPLCWRRRSARRRWRRRPTRASRKARRGRWKAFRSRIKDMFCTEGVRTTACSHILDNFVPTYEFDRDRQSVARRRGAARQDQLRRVRHGLVERDLVFRPGDLAVAPQGLQHAADAGRLVRRLGGGGGGAIVPRRHRHRHRRLDPPAGGLHRHRRHQADLRPLLALGHRRLCLLARSGRPVRAHACATPRSCCARWPGPTPRTRPAPICRCRITKPRSANR